MPRIVKQKSYTEYKTAKPKTTPYKLSDGNGLTLLIRPSGQKVWQYHYTFDGKRQTITVEGNHRSHFIPKSAVDTIIDQVEIWMANGYAFNKQININFEWFDITRPHPHLTRFLQSMRKWHERRNVPFVYFWVLEADPIVGLHAHILIYTDTSRWNDLDVAMSNWLPFERDDLPRKKNTDFHTGDVRDIGMLHYLLKGLDKRHVPPSKRHEYTGFVIGKRWNMSKGPYGRRV